MSVMQPSPLIVRGVCEETANRLMMRHGSTMLLRAIRGEPFSTAAPKAKPARNSPYVPVTDRPVIEPPGSIRRMMADVAKAFNLSLEELTGKDRGEVFVAARAVAYRLIRDRKTILDTPRFSAPQIASFFGREHSTILHSLDHFEDYAKRWPIVRETYDQLSNGELGPCG